MGIDDIINERAPNQQAQQRQDTSESDSSSSSGIDTDTMLEIGGREFDTMELLLVLVAVDIALTLIVLERVTRRAVG